MKLSQMIMIAAFPALVACSPATGSYGSRIVSLPSTATVNATAVPCSSVNKPVYVNNVQFLLNNNCVSCHSGFNTMAGATADAANILQKVNSGQMPPSPAMLSTADRNTIVQWVACGKL